LVDLFVEIKEDFTENVICPI